jgi:hypothetical protein
MTERQTLVTTRIEDAIEHVRLRLAEVVPARGVTHHSEVER